MKIKELETRLSYLSESDKERIYEQIFQLVSQYDYDFNSEELKEKESEGCVCPHCGSLKTRKNGIIKGVQRFICNNCKKNFRPSTGSATVNIKKKELFKMYIPQMLLGKSIRSCAKEIGISIQTSFDWRHKILSSFNKHQDDIRLSGICESDDVYFTFSNKGERNLDRLPRKRGKGIFERKKCGINDEKIAVIISADRKGNKHLKVVKRGRISTKDIESVLKDKIEPKSVLCTDTHRSYTSFAKKNNIEHHTIKVSAKEYKRGIYHVQHINSIASDLKLWMNGFKGVSTKYLQNYLNWYAVIDIIEKAINPAKQTAKMIIASTVAWEQFKNICNLQYLY
jgi:transposase-like protein